MTSIGVDVNYKVNVTIVEKEKATNISMIIWREKYKWKRWMFIYKITHG